MRFKNVTSYNRFEHSLILRVVEKFRCIKIKNLCRFFVISFLSEGKTLKLTHKPR